MPSDREPLGRVIFESQLFGIPVLASDSGGNTELIKDGVTGYLYKLGNVNELASQILKVKDNNYQLAMIDYCLLHNLIDCYNMPCLSQYFLVHL